MKKILMLIIAGIMVLSLFGCSTVEEDGKILKADIDKYVLQVEEAFGTLESDAKQEYEAIKETLNQDVVKAKEEVERIDEVVVAKIEKIADESKKLTIDNQDIKKLHDELVALYDEQLAAGKKLVTSIENGVEEDYQEAKAEFEEIVAKITTHKQAIVDSASE